MTSALVVAVWLLGTTVEVVDEQGRPITGASVVAVESWDTRVLFESFPEGAVYGPKKTGADGRVEFPLGRWLIGGGTYAAYAEAPGMPAQGIAPDAPNRIVLGPPRDLEGRVRLPPDCPPGALEVRATPEAKSAWETAPIMPQAFKARVSPGGNFILRGLGPGPYMVRVVACGQEVRKKIVAAQKGATVELVFDGAKPGAPLRAPESGLPEEGIIRTIGSATLGSRLSPTAFDSLRIDPVSGAVLAVRSKAKDQWSASLFSDGTELPLAGGQQFADRDFGEAGASWSVANAEWDEFVWFRSTRKIVPLGFCAPPIQRASVVACAGNGGLVLGHADGRVEHLSTGSSLALSPDGEVVAWVTHEPSQIHLRRVADGKEQVLSDEVTWILPAAHHTFIALMGHRLMRVDADAGTLRPLCEAASRGVETFAVSSDGRLVGASRAADTVLVDLATGTCRTIPVSTGRAPRFEGRWLLGVVGSSSSSNSHAIAIDTATGKYRLLLKDVSTDNRVQVFGEVAFYSEHSSDRVMACVLSTGKCRAIERGQFRGASDDGAWALIEDTDEGSAMRAVRSDGMKKFDLGQGFGVFAPGSHVLWFKHGRFTPVAPLSAIDLSTGTRVSVAPDVRDHAPVSARSGLVSVESGPQGAGTYTASWRWLRPASAVGSEGGERPPRRRRVMRSQ